MAIFRPSVSTGGSKAPFLGFKEINFLKVEEPEPKPEWADIYWNIECEVEGSQYTNTLRVSGSLERDAEGNLVDCGLLKRLYYFLDCINFDGGLDIQGNWVNQAGDPIPDVLAELNTSYMKREGQRGYMAYGYIFKEQPKNPTDKPYTKIQSKVVQNTPQARKELEEYIKFMKEKKHLREADDSNQGQSARPTTPF